MSRYSETCVLLLGLSLAGCGSSSSSPRDSGTGRDGGGVDTKRDAATDGVTANDAAATEAGAASDLVARDGVATIDGLAVLDGAEDGRADGARDVATTGETGAPVDGGALDGAGLDVAISEAGGAIDGQPSNVFVATLSGAEVVPPVATSAGGSATFVLSADRTQLTYAITQTVANATSAQIAMGAAGEQGPGVYPLTPLTSAMSGIIMLNPGDADNLEKGMLFVLVTSQANPAGEVRGQILHSGESLWVANMTGGQETPSVSSTATGHAAVILDPSQPMIRYHVTTTGIVGATAAHFHKAVATLPGPVVYPISPVGPTMDGSIVINSQDAADLMAGRWFVNVHTTANPNGEIRGQLIMPGEVLYVASLSGNDEVPPVTTAASGGAEFMLSPSGTSLRYVADITGVAATAASIDKGAAGSNGPVVFPLAFSAGGLMGTLTVTAVDVTNLNASGYYVNIQTAANPNGELRGQIGMQ